MDPFTIVAEVLESISSTVDGGIYNIVSHTELNPLALDATAKALLESKAGTELTAIVNDAGQTIGYMAKGAAQAGNGAAADVSTYINVISQEVEVTSEMAAETYIEATTGEVAQLTAGETVETLSASSTGAGILAMDVGFAGAAIAPALGVLAGVGLYNLAPEFWTGVSNRLVAAGKTVGGKIQAIFDSDGKTSIDEGTIEIIKDALINSGIYDLHYNVPAATHNIPITWDSESFTLSMQAFNDTNKNCGPLFYPGSTPGYIDRLDLLLEGVTYEIARPSCVYGGLLESNDNISVVYNYDVTGIVGSLYSTDRVYGEWSLYSNNALISGTSGQIRKAVQNNVSKYIINTVMSITPENLAYSYWYNVVNSYRDLSIGTVQLALIAAQFLKVGYNDNVQPSAVLPSDNPFPQDYPTWQPSTTIGNDNYYPVGLPTDNTTQDESQSGDNDDPEKKDKLVNIIFVTPEIDPQPDPDPDPDPAPEPEPEPDQDVIQQDDPIDPNPDPDPSDPTPPLPVVESTSASSMFCVYNPTDGEVNALGAFLWTSSIIEQIKQMWSDPMNCIISFHKVYAQPIVGSAREIKLGYVASGVSALQVTSQFVEINCGAINVNERLHNATDYTPFTKSHLYLPFVGIVEIDITDIMAGNINVKYKVDVYTGTCIAMVFCQRSKDMTSAQMLYSFSGNAAQQLPLTGANFQGAINGLLGLAGAGIAVATGGGIGLAAGAVSAAHSLTQEMVHVQRSSGLSSNAGIMAPRKPYLILSRQSGYDANGYNSFYGYPANKTVYLSNCSGFTKVKYINLRTNATAAENDIILQELHNGVLI